MFFIFTCWANSLVGAKIKAWQSFTVKSSCCKIAIENVAVLPVPDCAWAITSFPKKKRLMVIKISFQKEDECKKIARHSTI